MRISTQEEVDVIMLAKHFDMFYVLVDNSSLLYVCDENNIGNACMHDEWNQMRQHRRTNTYYFHHSKN